MIVHNDPLLSIYFGDSKDALNIEDFDDYLNQNNLLKYPELKSIKKVMNLELLFLQKQVHGTQGTVINADKILNFNSDKKEGDFLATQIGHLGLGVYTADCLPIVFYDVSNYVIGICHAGWSGSIEKIAVKTILKMQEQFGTKLDCLRIFFGPSAKVCCYEVSDNFKKSINSFNSVILNTTLDKTLIKHKNKLYFDLPLFNRLQIESLGVKKEAFHFSYNLCTICNTSFCSYRREGKKAKRQLTVVALK